MKKNKRKFLSILTLGALASSFIFSTGCDNKDPSYVAIIFKNQGQFWEIPKLGAKHAGEEMNIKLTINAPKDEDVKAQAKMVNDAISKKADAIIIAPSADDDELADALTTAQNNGIKVLTVDSDMREEVRSSCISTNNEYAGAISARKAYEIMNGKGEICILMQSMDSTNAIARADGFKSQIQQYNQEVLTEVNKNEDDEEVVTEKNEPLKISAVVDGQSDVQKSKDAIIQTLNDKPEIKVIFTTSQTTTVGACMAVDELGLADSVDILGFDSFKSRDGSKSSDEYLKNDVLDGFILQNPYNIGYLGVRYARDLINGQSIAAYIDTGATLVTKDNVNDSDIQIIMNPMEN